MIIVTYTNSITHDTKVFKCWDWDEVLVTLIQNSHRVDSGLTLKIIIP